MASSDNITVYVCVLLCLEQWCDSKHFADLSLKNIPTIVNRDSTWTLKDIISCKSSWPKVVCVIVALDCLKQVYSYISLLVSKVVWPPLHTISLVSPCQGRISARRLDISSMSLAVARLLWNKARLLWYKAVTLQSNYFGLLPQKSRISICQAALMISADQEMNVRQRGETWNVPHQSPLPPPSPSQNIMSTVSIARNPPSPQNLKFLATCYREGRWFLFKRCLPCCYGKCFVTLSLCWGLIELESSSSSSWFIKDKFVILVESPSQRGKKYLPLMLSCHNNCLSR